MQPFTMTKFDARMGKSKKKSNKSKINIEKKQPESQTQESKPSSAQIDSEPCDTSEQIEVTKGETPDTTILSEGSDSFEDSKSGENSNTKLTEESDSIREDIAESDMKRQSEFSGPSDSTGSSKRRSGRDYQSSRYRNDRESNHDRGKFSNERRSEQYKRSSQNEDWPQQNKRTSCPTGYSNNRMSRNARDQDDEFLRYKSELASHQGNIKFIKTKEIVLDLFKVPEDYALAHCVAEDMNMGSGIAVQFRYRFKRVDALLNQHQRTGGLAVIEDKDRYIYYLVTKRFSTGKPTLATLFSSLKRLREHVIENRVKKIAMPRIGCGLDRLEWEDVKFMIEFLFQDVDVEILVCNLEPTGDSSPQRHRNCRLTNETYPIQDIEAGTVILYFSSEDEAVSDEMTKLDEKFHFLTGFKYARKSLGSVVIHDKNPNYLLCGCIVRKSKSDPFDFVALQRCLYEIQKENKKKQFYYYAFQAMKDADSSLNYKIINILRNNLRDVEVYVCWPGDLQEEMTPRDRFTDRESTSYARTRSPKEQTGTNWRTPKSSAVAGEKNGSVPSSLSSREAPRAWHQTDSESEIDKNPQNLSWTNYRRQNSNPTPTINITFRNRVRDSKPYEYYTSWSDSEKQESSDQEQPSHTPPVQEQHNQANDSYEIDTWDPQPPSTEKNETTKLKDMSFGEQVNHEYETFQLDLESGNIDCGSLKEQHPSTLPRQYSRVCFASEDLMINDGIPPGQDIGDLVGQLLNQNEKAGGVAYSKEGNNFLYCLIISGATTPPSPYTVFSAIQKLRDHASKHNTRYLVIPKMTVTDDCGFKWEDVKCMFQFLLGRKLDMVVAQFSTAYNSASLTKKNGSKITHVKFPIHQMKKKSAIIYLTSVDGVLSEEMKGLDKKFEFVEEFKKKKKFLGEVIRYKQNEDHVLYGCVVKLTHDGRVNFEELQKCLKEVDKLNTENLPFVGIQAINDQVDALNYKIATIMLSCLHKVTIMMCWPGDLRGLMPGFKA